MYYHDLNLQIQIVQVLHSDHEVPMDDIAILTPYSAQKRTLQKKVADMTKEFSSLKIVTISESQGMTYTSDLSSHMIHCLIRLAQCPPFLMMPEISPQLISQFVAVSCSFVIQACA